jgi:hypothetical protein
VLAAGGGQLDLDALCDPREGLGGLAIGFGEHDRVPRVTACPQRGDERDLAEQRYLEALGEVVAAAGTEQLVALAVVAGEPAHVLDDALDAEVHLLGHEAGALRHALRRGLRRRDDVELRVREELRERQRDVAGARRQVDEQVVGLVPEHVGEELLEGLVQHRAPPDDRLVLLGEEAHRDAAHAAGSGGRHQQRVDDRGRVLDTQHARDREAPDVGVDDRDVATALRQRDGQVGRHRRLAHAALARRDQHHARLARGVGERDGTTFGVAVGGLAAGRGRGVTVELLAQVGPLLVGHHAEGQVDRRHADGGQRTRDPRLDLVAQRAPGHGERDLEGHGVAVTHHHVAHHVEVDDRAMELGVLDRTQGSDDVIDGDGHWEGSGLGGCRLGDFHYGRR